MIETLCHNIISSILQLLVNLSLRILTIFVGYLLLFFFSPHLLPVRMLESHSKILFSHHCKNWKIQDGLCCFGCNCAHDAFLSIISNRSLINYFTKLSFNKAVWRNGSALDVSKTEISLLSRRLTQFVVRWQVYQEVAGSTPASVIFFQFFFLYSLPFLLY